MLENKLADFDLTEKAALTSLHWLPEQYDHVDYYDMQRILSTKEREERVVDPMSLL